MDSTLAENRQVDNFCRMKTLSPADSPFLQPKLPNLPATPDFCAEDVLISHGFRHIVGIDEAGRGPLAGPVVAAAVVLDPTCIPDNIHDSKKLRSKEREEISHILYNSASIGVGIVGHRTIDQINIRNGTLLAMKLAVEGLPLRADVALIDGRDIPRNLNIPGFSLIKGDQRSQSIAAASIIAKTLRDQFMERWDKLYPDYGFAGHKGYGTQSHRDIIHTLGPCPIHRMSFSPMRFQSK